MTQTTCHPSDQCQVSFLRMAYNGKTACEDSRQHKLRKGLEGIIGSIIQRDGESPCPDSYYTLRENTDKWGRYEGRREFIEHFNDPPWKDWLSPLATDNTHGFVLDKKILPTRMGQTTNDQAVSGVRIPKHFLSTCNLTKIAFGRFSHVTEKMKQPGALLGQLRSWR